MKQITRRQSFKTPDSLIGTTMGRRHRPDYILLVCMFLLLTLGLVIIYSVSPALSAQLTGDVDSNHFMYRQIIYLVLGFGVFTAASNIPLSWWAKIQKYILWIAIFSFLLLFIPQLSLNYGGATRWVQVGPLSYQPAELLKFGLIFYLAIFLARRLKGGEVNSAKTISPFLLIMAVVALEIVLIQRDMGTMIPIVAIMLTMLYLTGIKMRQYLKVLVIIIFAGCLMVAVAPHRVARVFTFLNPSADTSGSGYHINQALIAVGSGGVMGKGLGRSVQAFGYLPEAANDSIFAILAEKFGFIGTLFVFALYGVLLIRIVDIVAKAPNSYLRFVAGGVFAWICVQAFVNIGAMLGIMPLTGVTLPFLSFGGTSLIFTLAALGVVFNISRFTTLGHQQFEGENHADSTRRRRVGRPRYAA